MIQIDYNPLRRASSSRTSAQVLGYRAGTMGRDIGLSKDALALAGRGLSLSRQKLDLDYAYRLDQKKRQEEAGWWQFAITAAGMLAGGIAGGVGALGAAVGSGAVGALSGASLFAGIGNAVGGAVASGIQGNGAGVAQGLLSAAAQGASLAARQYEAETERQKLSFSQDVLAPALTNAANALSAQVSDSAGYLINSDGSPFGVEKALSEGDFGRAYSSVMDALENKLQSGGVNKDAYEALKIQAENGFRNTAAAGIRQSMANAATETGNRRAAQRQTVFDNAEAMADGTPQADGAAVQYIKDASAGWEYLNEAGKKDITSAMTAGVARKAAVSAALASFESGSGKDAALAAAAAAANHAFEQGGREGLSSEGRRFSGDDRAAVEKALDEAEKEQAVAIKARQEQSEQEISSAFTKALSVENPAERRRAFIALRGYLTNEAPVEGGYVWGGVNMDAGTRRSYAAAIDSYIHSIEKNGSGAALSETDLKNIIKGLSVEYQIAAAQGALNNGAISAEGAKHAFVSAVAEEFGQVALIKNAEEIEKFFDGAIAKMPPGIQAYVNEKDMKAVVTGTLKALGAKLDEDGILALTKEAVGFAYQLITESDASLLAQDTVRARVDGFIGAWTGKALQRLQDFKQGGVGKTDPAGLIKAMNELEHNESIVYRDERGNIRVMSARRDDVGNVMRTEGEFLKDIMSASPEFSGYNIVVPEKPEAAGWEEDGRGEVKNSLVFQAVKEGRPPVQVRLRNDGKRLWAEYKGGGGWIEIKQKQFAPARQETREERDARIRRTWTREGRW